MSEQERIYRVYGVDASPYTVKVRAVLRYRRLPHVWICRLTQTHPATAQVRPPIMPVVRFPDGAMHTDSTPIVEALEAAHPGVRSVLPDDPGQAFLARLLEDLADEWLTKCLFHYRFSTRYDGIYAARWVMDDAAADRSPADLQAAADAFLARQLSRMHLVGCTEENASLITATYARVLQAMESFVANERYLFGSRPSLADFGLYAQLRTLAADPTPMALMRERAPRTEHWVRRLDDASGVEGAWTEPRSEPSALESLLALAGELYLPFLDANARAADAGAAEVEVELAGRLWRQPVFRYQAKCLSMLRHRFTALPAASRAALEPLLERTGCLAVLAT